MTYTQHDLESAEALVLQYGLKGVLELLEAICKSNAQDTLEVWDDPVLSSYWRLAAIHLKITASLIKV